MNQKIYYSFLFFVIILFSCAKQKNNDAIDSELLFMSNSVDTVAVLFAPNIISTGHHIHSSAIFSPDMSHILFTIADNPQHVICEMKHEKNVWSNPEVVSFSGRYSDHRPFYSSDGNRLYFESKRPFPGSNKSGKWGIWSVTKKDGNWTQPKFDSVFTSLEIETPSIAANSNLYFVSNKRGGEGNADVFISKYVDGNYTAPVNLGPQVNSKFMEAYLHIAPDESYLLFSSFGRPEGSGIFISVKDNFGKWSKPKLITEISKNGDERFVKVNPDGKYIFFNRQFDMHGEFSKERLTIKSINSRMNSPQNGNGDVYWISSKILEKYK